MAERIAILGAGAIGLFYGARLALSGQDVHFLVRSELEAVRSRGITLQSKEGSETLSPVQVHSTAESIGPADLVFVTLKATANDQLAQLLPPLLGPQTAVVTLQNGLGNEEVLARWVDRGQILGGLCFIACMRVAPGVVNCLHRGSITLGEYDRPASNRTRHVAALLEQAGVPCRCVDSLAEARWRKLVWNIPFNGLSVAAGGITTDVICADPDLAAEVRALMEEVRTAAHALGYDVPAAFAQKQFDVTPPMGPYQPSSLVDFKAGRPLEVEAIWGEPLRRAAAAGVATPRLALLHALLRRLTKV